MLPIHNLTKAKFPFSPRDCLMRWNLVKPSCFAPYTVSPPPPGSPFYIFLPTAPSPHLYLCLVYYCSLHQISISSVYSILLESALPLKFDLYPWGEGHGVQGQICYILRPQLAMNRFLTLWPQRFPHFEYIHLWGAGVGGL
jgi:hypothetical protein